MPLDIWPGLRDAPRRYEVRAVCTPRTEGGKEGEDEDIEDGVESIQ